MIRTLRRRTGIVAALVVALVLLPAGTSDAAGEVVEVGWWTRSPTSSAPEGGISVSSAPDGPVSVGAVRVDAGEGLAQLTLTAVEAGGSPQAVSVQVCRAADAWSAADGGSLEDAPELDCDDGVDFVRADDGTWSADVTSLVLGRSGTVSLGLRAVGGDTDPLGIPLEVQFERPTASGVEDAPAPASPSPGPTTTTTSPSTTTTTSPATGASSPTPVAAAPTTTVTSTTTTTAPSTTTTSLPLVEERAQAARSVGATSGAEGRPLGEAVFLVVLAGFVGVGVWGSSRFAERRA